MTFAVHDWVEWAPVNNSFSGMSGAESRKGVVTAIDKLTTPHTYIIKFEDGSKKGAKESQLKVTDPPPAEGLSAKGEAMMGNIAGKMKGLLGTMSTAGAKTMSGLKEKMATVNIVKKEEKATEQKKETPVKKEASPKPAAASEDGTLDKLVEMGYPVNTAQSALLLADGDIEQALCYLKGEEKQVSEGESEQGEEEEPARLDDVFPQDPSPVAAQVPSPTPTPTVSEASPVTVQSDDAFDFLTSTPQPSAVSVQPPPQSISVTSVTPGHFSLSISRSDLPPGPVAATHISIGIKPVVAAKWRHQVDARSGTPALFSCPVEWKQTCYPFAGDGPLKVNIAVGTVFPEVTAFEVCARVATPMGPGPASSPVVAVDVPIEIVHVDVTDLDDFFSFSPGGAAPVSPTPAQKRVYYPPHAKGAIYDVD
eukprot:TRINITY_DN317_c0_g1_i1.p1 TRINITY_DN317_c0_g1~~TRINITY_DN317_c0_g1_i1.p1  ORF type:complete len:423 (+),score=102.43 TRINITY_DN317_c0_g1_i1:289-1557(+)